MSEDKKAFWFAKNQPMADVNQCSKCGLPLCSMCSSKMDMYTEMKSGSKTTAPAELEEMKSRNYHLKECELLQGGEVKDLLIKSVKDVRHLYAIITPLRLLLSSKEYPYLFDLEVRIRKRYIKLQNLK